MIHIEGMGWFGSITALALERAEVPFTWHDSGAAHTAWKASTGIVYPAGDERSELNRHRWQRWVLDGWLPNGSAKMVQYQFAHKKPPHEGAYEWRRLSSGLGVAAHSAVAVAVQTIVTEARSRFEHSRLGAAPRGTPTIVAHGHERAKGWVWGWSRKVALANTGEAVLAAYYGKRHRFDLTYLYPVADEPGWWYAGSALVNERKPRERTATELTAEWMRWCEAKEALFPALKVLRVQPMVQGWRPKPASTDDGQLIIDEQPIPGGGPLVPRLVYPALWHSGVRWAPTLVEQATSWAASFR